GSGGQAHSLLEFRGRRRLRRVRLGKGRLEMGHQNQRHCGERRQGYRDDYSQPGRCEHGRLAIERPDLERKAPSRYEGDQNEACPVTARISSYDPLTEYTNDNTMNLKILPLTLTVAAALTLLPGKAFAWGCSRSASASGYRGGSISHTGSTSGGWGGWSHSGSTTATGPHGGTYSTSTSASGHYGYGGC